VDKLAKIGFYTLEDERAAKVSSFTPLWRCEMLLTSRCNFNCTYCRKRTEPDIPIEQARHTLDIWVSEGLKNIRFSGGEPTLYPHLLELVKRAKEREVEHIAISTNGTAPLVEYERLVEAGVNDFSVSLDACCSETGDKIAGKKGSYDTVISAIRYLSERTYVTLGVVLFEENISEVEEIVQLGYDLGVSDIRLISAAQWDKPLHTNIPQHIRNKMPILNYRLTNLELGRHVRGIKDKDCNHCPLVLDDMAVEGNKHYPCIIYLRERGESIGEVGPFIRKERLDWYGKHNTHADPICRKNCLDVCVDYNNQAARSNFGLYCQPFEEK
jgi:sulfatase maturation enzyme AslB (radical SAM superfamily)